MKSMYPGNPVLYTVVYNIIHDIYPLVLVLHFSKNMFITLLQQVIITCIKGTSTSINIKLLSTFSCSSYNLIT